MKTSIEFMLALKYYTGSAYANSAKCGHIRLYSLSASAKHLDYKLYRCSCQCSDSKLGRVCGMWYGSQNYYDYAKISEKLN